MIKRLAISLKFNKKRWFTMVQRWTPFCSKTHHPQNWQLHLCSRRLKFKIHAQHQRSVQVHPRVSCWSHRLRTICKSAFHANRGRHITTQDNRRWSTWPKFSQGKHNQTNPKQNRLTINQQETIPRSQRSWQSNPQQRSMATSAFNQDHISNLPMLQAQLKLFHKIME